MQQWFKKLRSGAFNLENGPRSGAFQDEDLKAFVEANPLQTVREIAEGADLLSNSGEMV